MYSLAELRMYRAADSKRNGVVGSTGRNIPIHPTPTTGFPIESTGISQYNIAYFAREDSKKQPT